MLALAAVATAFWVHPGAAQTAGFELSNATVDLAVDATREAEFRGDRLGGEARPVARCRGSRADEAAAGLAERPSRGRLPMPRARFDDVEGRGVAITRRKTREARFPRELARVRRPAASPDVRLTSVRRARRPITESRGRQCGIGYGGAAAGASGAASVFDVGEARRAIARPRGGRRRREKARFHVDGLA